MTTGWENLSPATSMPLMFGQKAAYNPKTGKVLMYGGATSTGGAYVNYTYEWDGINWTLLTPAHNLGNRINVGMCYDPVLDTIIAIGGQAHVGSTFPYMTDTWKWTGTDWVQLTPTHHSAMGSGTQNFFRLAHDENNGNVVIWEYLSAVGSAFGATWIWNGADWIIQAPVTKPPHRFSELAYDPVRKRVVMGPGNFAGVTNVYADVWEWDGSNWVNNTSPLPTTPFVTSYMSNYVWQYSKNCGGIVLAQGTSQLSSQVQNETWLYSSEGVWSDLAPASPPPERNSIAHAVDKSGKILMFGGLKDDNVTFRNDTWHFSCATPSFPVMNNLVSIA